MQIQCWNQQRNVFEDQEILGIFGSGGSKMKGAWWENE